MEREKSFTDTYNKGSVVFLFNRHICKFCDRTFPSLESLRAHLLTHVDVNRYPYEFYDKRFSSSDLLNERLRNVPGDICNVTFPTSAHLKEHLAIHSKQFERDICSSTLSIEEKLIAHNRTEHKEKGPFVSEMWNKQFPRKFGLTSHLPSHTCKKVYRCEKCRKEFYIRSNFRIHLLAHVKLHKCGKIFAQKNNFNAHLRDHMKKKPHVCQFCDMAFSLPRYLKAHLLLHKKFQKFNSKVCDQRFSRFSNYKAHLVFHPQERLSSDDEELSRLLKTVRL